MGGVPSRRQHGQSDYARRMADGRCSSEQPTQKFTFEWSVSDFESTTLFSASEESPVYSCSIDRSFVSSDPCYTGPVSLAWKLRVDNDMEFTLTRPQSELPPSPFKWCADSLDVGFKISLLNRKGGVCSSKTTTGTFDAYDRNWNLQGPSLSVNFLDNLGRTSDLKACRRHLLAGRNLEVRFEVTVYGKVVHAPVRTKPCSPQVLESSYNNLGNQMELLRQEDFLTDFTLVVGVHEFKVHKFILAARSPVFKRMFEMDMKECSSVLEDITAEAVDELLTYLYTGTAPNLEELTEELFEAVNEYELPHLIALCKEALGNSINIVNAVRTLILADRHCASDLKSVCICFIEEHMPAVKETGEWGDLKERHHQLYVELLEAQLSPSKKPECLMH